MSRGVVIIEPDPFQTGTKDRAHYLPLGQLTQTAVTLLGDSAAPGAKGTALSETMASVHFPSRPLNGVRVKPNTHAYVQVLRSDGEVLKVFNQLGYPAGNVPSGFASRDISGLQATVNDPSKTRIEREAAAAELAQKLAVVNQAAGTYASSRDSSPAGHVWNDWLLQSVVEQRMEKTQLIETFGSSYLYAFGQKPRTLSFKGILLNTEDYNWRAVFWENWDRFFRATKLIELDARMFVGWDDILVSGYPISAHCAESADSPNAMQFAFTFLVSDYTNYSASTGFAQQRRARLVYSRGGRPGDTYRSGESLGSLLNAPKTLTADWDFLSPRWLDRKFRDSNKYGRLAAFYAQAALLHARSPNWKSFLSNAAMGFASLGAGDTAQMLQGFLRDQGYSTGEADYALRALQTMAKVFGVYTTRASPAEKVLHSAQTVEDLIIGLAGLLVRVGADALFTTEAPQPDALAPVDWNAGETFHNELRAAELE
jgi:hypothetical protein